MRVFVYFNLHKRVYSIKAMEGRCKGRVIAHASRVIIREATFKVSLAGQRRVIETGHKTVHAGVVGELEAYQGEATLCARKAWLTEAGWWTKTDTAYGHFAMEEGKALSYNPHRAPYFTREDAPAQWVKASSAPMVFCGLTSKARGSKTFMISFDPCMASEPFPAN